MNSKLLYIAIAVLVIISIVSGFYIWVFRGTRGIDLQIDVPDQIMRGVPFDLSVNFTNKSGSVLEDAVLTINLPEGAAFWGSDTQKNVDNKSLGNVGIDGLIQETYKVILFSAEETKRDFKATLTYSPAALSARFEAIENLTVDAELSGISVEMSAPEKITSGEEFEFTIKYKNISDTDFSGLELKLEYPPSFTYNSSSLEPDTSNNVWRLGDLRKNSEGEFMVRGSLIGAEEDSFDLKSLISLRAAGQNYIIDETSVPLVIASAPLSLQINLNNEEDYNVVRGDNLTYTISYINNTKENLQNLVIRAQLVGEMFDTENVKTNGIFRSADNMLIWNSSTNPELSHLSSGSAGAISFEVKVKNEFPIKRFGDKNFLLTVNGDADSISSTGSKLISKAKFETKVRGELIIDAQGLFRDAASGILNAGLMPPKVDVPTQFTIHWILKSFASDFSGIEVSAALGNNVKVVGSPKSNSGLPPYYDDEKQVMIWRVDKLQANQGLLGQPIEAIFQIEAIPTAGDVGKYMTLIRDTFVSGTDSWIEKDLLNNDISVNTALPDDPTIGGQGGVVQP